MEGMMKKNLDEKEFKRMFMLMRQIRLTRSEARHLERAIVELSHMLFYKQEEKEDKEAENKEKEPIPSTLDEALDILKEAHKENDGGWDIFKDYPEEDAIGCCHFTTGRAMRNNWGLFKGDSPLALWFKERGVHHADDMSSIILLSFHRVLNGKDIEFEKQVEDHKKYWEEHSETTPEGTDNKEA